MTHPRLATPLAEGIGLPWDVPVVDAVAEIAAARAAYGDTFVVESGRDRYLFTFSPRGVESFYALPEEVASKGVADYLMLRRKLPEEIFDGRRTLPHLLFRKGDVVHYLADTSALASPQLVTAFGHGKHSCPAQPFSLAAMTKAVTHLCGGFELTPRWSSYPQPVPAQIGGVARAASPCPVDYRRGSQT